MKNGTIVNVISVSNGWAKINYNGTVAYCSASYLKAVATNESSTVEMIVKADDLNVRSGASTKHSILGKVYKGDKVTVIQSLSNGWVKIEYKGKYGFVSNVNGAYLETSLTSNNPIVNTPIDSSGTYKKREMIAKVDDLNVREGDVKYARSAFRTLSPSDQLLVINIDKLDKAEAEWKRIDNGIKYVTGEIDKIPSIESLTLKDKHLVSNARLAYDNANKKITYHVNYINYDILEKSRS